MKMYNRQQPAHIAFSIHYLCAFKRGVIRLQQLKSNRRSTEQNDIHEINYEHDSNMEMISQANEWQKSMCLYGRERVYV